MPSADEIVNKLKSMANLENVKGMAKFGMTSEKRLGISVPEMRKMAKEIGKDHKLALNLWKTGIPEARIVASMVGEPDKLTEKQMESWVKGINSWDVCDQVCMNLFEKTPLAWKKIHDWSEREDEFVKRAAFSLIACLAWHNKEISDEKFFELFPVILRNATDDRNYVKKALNWALRHIGKRNLNSNKAAIKVAKEIREIDSKTSRWIASDAILELESEAVQKKLKRMLSQSAEIAE
jgi:3-methyladenine DNA glycosylase AlkD